MLETVKKSNAGLHRFVLDNGMVCLVKEDRSAPVAAVQFWVGTGSIHEQEWLGSGLSHYVEHMFFKGTPTRKPGDIFKEINNAGGQLNAYTSLDRTVFHATLPAKNWTVALDAFADALMHAAFPEAEWEREKQVILREFAMGRDNPDRELGELCWDTAYRVHPYRVPVIGYEDVFKARTRHDLQDFFRRHYVPDNMIAVVIGDVRAADVEQQLRRTFADFKRSARAPVILPREPEQLAPREARKTGAYEVGRLVLAFHGVAISHPDAAALDVLAMIVGGGRSSRLVRELRERRQLAFEIDAWSANLKEPGLFGINATFDPARERELTAAIRAELAGWAKQSFTDEEIARARRTVLVNELGSLQTVDGQASAYASGEFYAADPCFAEQYIARIEAVDSARLQEVVRRYLAPENGTLVVLTPPGAGSNAVTAATAPAVVAPQLLTLTNGVRLIVHEDRRLPFVAICAALQGGLLTEPADRTGLARLTSDLLTRGTEKLSAEDIARTVENLGATLAPFSGQNSFGLQTQGLSQDRKALLAILADCLCHSVFPAAELDKQRTLQLAELQQEKERPFFVAEEGLRSILYPDHPYRWTPEGTEAGLHAVQRKDCADYLRRHLVGGNLVLSVFGDIAPAEARRLVEQNFAALPRGAAPEPVKPGKAAKLPARIKAREPKQQAILLVGYPGVDLRDPRADALAVVDHAMSGLSSDLGVEVRDKRGLVYFVGSSSRAGVLPGHFMFYAGTREDQVPEVERLIGEQIARVVREGLRPEEFSRARELLLAQNEIGRQNLSAYAQTCALNLLYGLGHDYSLKLAERLARLTPEDARRAAADIFQDKSRAVSLVLPAAEPAKKKAAKK